MIRCTKCGRELSVASYFFNPSCRRLIKDTAPASIERLYYEAAERCESGLNRPGTPTLSVSDPPIITSTDDDTEPVDVVSSSQRTAAGLEGPKLYLGIDPGASGGLCVITSRGSFGARKLEGMEMKDVWAWIREVAEIGHGAGGIVAALEKVGGYMGVEAGGQGAHADGSSNRASGHTMFRFGRSAGMLEAFLIAAEIPYELVTPQRWQSHFGMKRGKTETKTAWKRRLKEHAQYLYPDQAKRITNNTGDAVLLARYALDKGEAE